MSSHHVLSETEVLRLPPMLFGSIRWPRGLGAPVGDPCSGFKIIVDDTKFLSSGSVHPVRRLSQGRANGST